MLRYLEVIVWALSNIGEIGALVEVFGFYHNQTDCFIVSINKHVFKNVLNLVETILSPFPDKVFCFGMIGNSSKDIMTSPTRNLIF